MHVFTCIYSSLQNFTALSHIIFVLLIIFFSLKSNMETYQCAVHANVALLVKWADFSSRDPRYSMNREYVFDCVTRFKDSLNVSCD